MTLLTLAAKNLRHNLRGYAAYFLSSAFAVWLFFLYASLLDHPQFRAKVDGELLRIMAFVAGVVAVFSALFILYSHSAFLKARQRDLGLLTLLGMLPGQVARTVHYENGMIGLGAITAGVGLGLVSLRLFFLAISRMLDFPEPLPFHFPGMAVLLCLSLFGLIFAAVSLYGQLKLWRFSIAELIRDASRPKTPPRFSWWFVGLCAASLGIAYYLALTTTDPDEHEVFAILGLSIAGTFLFFAQGSVAALRWLQRRRTVYYRGTALLAISQLVYKVRDNSRILSMVSILSAFILVLVNVFFGALQSAEEKALERAPLGVMMITHPNDVGPERVAQVLQEHGVQVTAQAQAQIIPGQVTQGVGEHKWLRPVIVIALSDFNRWQAQLGGPPVTLNDTQGLLLVPPSKENSRLDQQEDLSVAGHASPINLLTREHPLRLNEWGIVVLSDETFSTLSRVNRPIPMHGFALANWKKSRKAVAQLWAETRVQENKVGRQVQSNLTATIVEYDMQRQIFSFFLFLAAFVSLLFFLAAGNMLYFKLFTDLHDDRRQFQALHKVGLQSGEVRQAVSAQTFLLFFAPLVVGTIHAVVFTKMLSRVALFDVWRPLGSVALLYLILYSVYYLIARQTYVRALLPHRT
jgi:putative ABC transport system permease protein